MVRASPRRRGKSSRSGAAERRVGRDGGPAVRGETSVPRGKFRWYRGFVFALSRWLGAAFFSPLRGGLVLALTGGVGVRSVGGAGACTRAGARGGQLPFGGWSNAPPILSFAKRENAPCTVEERKRGRGAVWVRRYACPCPQRGASGGLEVDVRTVRLSSLSPTWRLRRSCAYRLLSVES